MRSRISRFLSVTGVVAAGATAQAYAAFRKDLKAATDRIEEERQVIDSPHGPIEFGEAGDGPAVLFIHGAGGGFDQGLDFGRALLGDHYRVIAPSRFGYLGTALPDDASVDVQADAYLRLLDALQLDRVPVIGTSAGGPSALRFCIAHPERCSALVLIVPLAYAPQQTRANAPSPFFAKVLNAIVSSDLLFWTATKIAHSTLLKTILGTPVENYRNATTAGRRNVDAILRSILPISRRAAGIWNDGIVASSLTRDALEDIRVPTLIISAADDLYGTYESSFYTAEQIRDAKFVGYPTGGHLLVGHDAEVRSELANFLSARLHAETRPAKTG